MKIGTNTRRHINSPKCMDKKAVGKIEEGLLTN